MTSHIHLMMAHIHPFNDDTHPFSDGTHPFNDGKHPFNDVTHPFNDGTHSLMTSSLSQHALSITTDQCAGSVYCLIPLTVTYLIEHCWCWIILFCCRALRPWRATWKGWPVFWKLICQTTNTRSWKFYVIGEIFLTTVSFSHLGLLYFTVTVAI